MTETSTGAYKQAFEQAQEMLEAREFELALDQTNAILEIHPRDAKTHFLKGLALKNLGRHEQAVEIFQQLANATKNVAITHQELGFSLKALYRIDEAITALQIAVKIDPQLSGSWKMLGDLLYREENQAEAEQAYRRQMAASHRHPGIIKALELVQRERFGMAEGICRDYLQRYPDDVSVIRLLADIGLSLGIRHDPELLLERCLQLAPDYHFARNTYAKALGQAQKYDLALKEIDYLEQVEPDNMSHSILAASIQIMVGAFEEAADRYKHILERAPGYAQIHTSYGHSLKTLGRQKEAIAAYRDALAIQDSLGDAYWSLANLKTFRFDTNDIEKMRALVANPDCKPVDYFHLCFSLGKAYEDLSQFDDAADYYQKGNDAKCKQEQYRADDTTGETKALITSCTPELINKKSGYGCTAADPIFIVGLPRSGSTLLEQIIASHSQVDGTSELREIISIARRLSGKRNRDDDSQYPGILWDLSESECRELGEEYMERTRIQRQDAPYFIDKMPNNFQHVALINMILPNAKIIDSRRHPMATCFSGFKQLFAAGQTFTYSQTDIARYYRDYVSLMNHWDKAIPGKVLCVKYENVIADIEGEVRRILDYCGLPFEEQCLAFQNTERAIRTASSEQVRQPIYTTAVDQWRNFSAHLEPMQRELGSLISEHEAS